VDVPSDGAMAGHRDHRRLGRDRGGSTPGTGKRYQVEHGREHGRARNTKSAKHHYSKSANMAPPAHAAGARSDNGYRLDVDHEREYEEVAPSVNTDLSRARTTRQRHRSSKRAGPRGQHWKSRTMMVHGDAASAHNLQPPPPDEDHQYFIVDDKANGALSPEAALPQNGMANGVSNGMHGNGMNGARRYHSPRRHSPQHHAMDEREWNGWRSRTEMLEEDNVRLKSDVKKLKRTVRELTNTVQQIMQTLQQQ